MTVKDLWRWLVGLFVTACGVTGLLYADNLGATALFGMATLGPACAGFVAWTESCDTYDLYPWSYPTHLELARARHREQHGRPRKLNGEWQQCPCGVLLRVQTNA